MKILVTVHVKDENDLKNDPANWDVFGAAEALDLEMTKYPLSVFAEPTTSNYAESVSKNGYKWQVVVNPDLRVSPLISFFDIHQKNVVGYLEGTGKLAGEVRNKIAELASEAETANLLDIVLPVTAFASLLVAAFSNNKKIKVAAGVVGVVAAGASVFRFLPRLGVNFSKNTEGVENQKKIVFYTADYCGACKALKPSIDELAQLKGIEVVYVNSNTTEGEEMHRAAGVTVLPTLLLLEKKNEQIAILGRWDGRVDVAALSEKI